MGTGRYIRYMYVSTWGYCGGGVLMKDPRTAKNWYFLNPQEKDLWLHAYHAWLGKGKVN